MPFIPHTQSDIDAMLQAIGETSTAALFDEIPDDMRFKGELNLPDSLSEMALMRLISSAQGETKWHSILLVLALTSITYPPPFGTSLAAANS